MIDDSISVHDKFQIEMKLRFNQRKTQPDASWEIETFIFFPENFGIDPSTFGKADFYRDIKNYIRLQAPSFLVDKLDSEGILYTTKILGILAQAKTSADTIEKNLLLEEFKILACAYESCINKNFRRIKKGVVKIEDISDFFKGMERFITDFRTRLADHPSFSTFNDLRSLYQSVDDYMSLISEGHGYRVWELLDERNPGQHASTLNALREFLDREDQYRRHQHYPILQETETEERYAFRQKMLKKAVWSVLYLEKSKAEEGRLVSQVIYAAAAGIAMFFATALAFYYQNKYGNFTMPFFFAMVFGYMFKDRMKDGLRAMMVQQLHKKINDFRTNIIGGSGKSIGQFEERFSYIPERSLDGDILIARNRAPILGLGNEATQERVMAYRKKVFIDNQVFRRLYRSLETPGVVDITRFNVLPFIGKMDDPNGYGFVRRGEGYARIKCPRVYHINFVIRYRMGDLESRIRKFRVVLNRKGIKRIEKQDVLEVQRV